MIEPRTKKRAARTLPLAIEAPSGANRQALVEAIALAISALTLEDVAGWFAHCGYYPQDQYS